ncbi:MAG TPA: hypothetical protein VGR22_05740 [Thermomicrobiales bacterium]|nr:hypothetical protein [Thermomicrobiales bacterium]
MQVDDLRLALQWSGARLPSEAATEALYYFARTPGVWSQPADRLRDALIDVGRAMTDAIAIVVGNHVAQGDTVVIEGDGILPELLEHTEVRPHAASGAARMALLVPDSEHALLRAMLDRGRGIAEIGATPEARRAAVASW